MTVRATKAQRPERQAERAIRLHRARHALDSNENVARRIREWARKAWTLGRIGAAELRDFDQLAEDIELGEA